MGVKRNSYFNDQGGIPLPTLALIATAVSLQFSWSILRWSHITRSIVPLMNGRPVFIRTATSQPPCTHASTIAIIGYSRHGANSQGHVVIPPENFKNGCSPTPSKCSIATLLLSTNRPWHRASAGITVEAIIDRFTTLTMANFEANEAMDVDTGSTWAWSHSTHIRVHVTKFIVDTRYPIFHYLFLAKVVVDTKYESSLFISCYMLVRPIQSYIHMFDAQYFPAPVWIVWELFKPETWWEPHPIYPTG